MRMIDADALYDQALMMGLFDNQDRDIFLDAIDAQPTVYNVRRVVEELEALNPVDYGSPFSYEGHSCAREIKADAIDIVERGGIDE